MSSRVLLAVAVALIILAIADPLEQLQAQTMTVETIPPEVDDSGRTAGERVDEIVLTLRIFAAVVLVGTVAFWYFTRPAKKVKAESPVEKPVVDEVTVGQGSA